MHCRYLTSEDVKKMSSETVSKACASVRVDVDYEYREADTLSISASLDHVLKQNRENTANFDATKWDSVYWQDDWSRPDKVTHELNEIFTLDENNESHLKINEDKEEAYAKYSEEFGVGELSVSRNFEVGGSHEGKTEVQEVVNALNKNDIKSEWNGEKFVQKPMELYRVNMNDYETMTEITSDSVQVRKVTEQYSLALVVTPNAYNKAKKQSLHNFYKELEQDLENLRAEIPKDYAKIESENKNKMDKVKSKLESLEENPLWPKGNYCIFQQPKPRNLINGFNLTVCPESMKAMTASFAVDASYKKDNSIYNHLSMSDGSGLKALNFRTCCSVLS